MLEDMLRETPMYQHIWQKGFKEGFEEGFKQGFEEGFKEGFEEGFKIAKEGIREIEGSEKKRPQEYILVLRQVIVIIIESRFPCLEALAKKQVATLKQSRVLEYLGGQIRLLRKQKMFYLNVDKLNSDHNKAML